MKIPFCDTHQTDMFKTSFGVYICKQCWFERTDEQNYAELFEPKAIVPTESAQALAGGRKEGLDLSHE